ncbi:MAG: prolyl oligopeptidase family serine peptidase [Pseudomonadota bacterium]
MPNRLRAALPAAVLLFMTDTPLSFALPSSAPTGLPTHSAPLAYPDTRREDIVEALFGEQIEDPYRWLENDVRQDREVADWVSRQNSVTGNYLASLSQRDWFRRRIRELTNYERYGLPTRAGASYFYMRNSGLQNQAQLFVRAGLDGTARLLLDPNQWAKDGAAALDDWKPSEHGRYLLYSIQDGGSDWRTLRVIDVATGKLLEDTVQWAKFTHLAWIGEQGFLYSRFPQPAPGADFQAKNFNQAVWFHRIGTPQEQDVLVYATPERPEANHVAEVTADGRTAIITSSIGTDARYEIHTVALTDRASKRAGAGWQVRPLVTGFKNDWKLVEGMRGTLWFVTNLDAPRYRIVSIDTRRRKPEWREVVPQAVNKLERGTIVGNKLILAYLDNASTRAVVYDLGGRPARAIELSDIGTASGFRGRPGDPETFYSFTSFNRPSTVYRLDLATGETRPFAEPELSFAPADFDIQQRFFPSKDGTRIPLFVVRRKAIASSGKPVPTLLYGYGGFDVALTPGFSAARMAWLDAGGAFALANLRGGGEFGKAWHDAGRGANKQNVFDDFIAAAEYLIAEKITPADGLVVQGGSNGGLLVGAVVNQRPELFAAANPQVGVMDMLRFDRFTAGRYWVDDYGHPDRAADFNVLRSYSPYHNIRRGKPYPAVLVTTADTDDRVVPGHSFKYAAALQAARLGDKPQLIRIETRAGHGSGKPTDKAIEENADILAFLAHWSGLRPGVAVPGSD